MNLFRKWQDDFKAMLDVGIPINSMAYRQLYVEERLTSSNEVRFEHLLKLYFYPEASQYHGVWKRSVYSATMEVLRFKRNNRYPDKDFIMDAIWYAEDPEDFPVKLSGIVHCIAFKISEFDEPVHPLPLEVVNDCIKYLYNYHDWLSTELSTLGFVTNTSVYTKIDELLKQSIYKK